MLRTERPAAMMTGHVRTDRHAVQQRDIQRLAVLFAMDDVPCRHRAMRRLPDFDM
jgi:hypothetical protein